MDNITIRKAGKDDLASVSAIYNDVLSVEEAGGTSNGWVRGIYPTEETASKSIDAEELFVMLRNDFVIAALRINQVQMPAYEQIKWKTEADAKAVMTFHTLVVSPAENGKGYGTRFVKFFEAYALTNDCPYLRIDTSAANIRARSLYARLGYRESGIVRCSFCGIPDFELVCMEKALI